jgi:hypothetical protein
MLNVGVNDVAIEALKHVISESEAKNLLRQSGEKKGGSL